MNNILTGFWAATKEVLRSPLVMLAMLLGVALFVMVRVLQVNLFQPLLGDKGFSAAHFGWVMAAMTVSEAFGAKNAKRLKDGLKDSKALYALTLAIALVMAGLAPSGPVLTVALLCLYSLAAGLAFPIQRQLINDSIGASRYRATILSLESMLDRGVCALAVAPLGGLISQGRIDPVLILSAGGSAVFVSVVYLGMRRQEKLNEVLKSEQARPSHQQAGTRS